MCRCFTLRRPAVDLAEIFALLRATRVLGTDEQNKNKTKKNKTKIKQRGREGCVPFVRFPFVRFAPATG